MLGTAASTGKYTATATATLAPHVVFVVVDDLGYHDWGWTNAGQVHTPVVDSLVSAAGAIVLENYYMYVEVREQHPLAWESFCSHTGAKRHRNSFIDIKRMPEKNISCD